MEGVLLVPPERGTIIGRALWKPRFVIVGGVQKGQQTNLTATQVLSTSRIQAANRASNLPGSNRVQPKDTSEGVFLSIYKSKDDVDPIQQHALTSITDCQIQNVAHRKQGPALPTLIINISPDPATDKLRKRRSSRTAGLTTTKEVHPTSLWFRPGDDEHTLQDWAKYIQPMIQTSMPDRSPLSPISPTSPGFSNPFAPRREFADLTYRPSSSNGRNWGGLRHQFSINTQSSRERPLTYSDCPSLHSKRSDVSSHTSSVAPHQTRQQNYAMAYSGYRGHPGELPSPATTLGDYKGEFIEGWTSAQGRSPTLSSPIRGREDSLESHPATFSDTLTSPTVPSSPPAPLAPRETILDRAFQLRCIPGSENTIPGEEKLSSLARFEALMKEVDEKRKLEDAESARPKVENDGSKSAWDLDDDEDDDSDEEEEEEDEESDGGAYERDAQDRYTMPPPAARTMDYFTSRHQSPRPQQRSRAQTGTPLAPSPLNYNAETLQALDSGSSLLRPQTSYGRNRPDMAQRTYSQPQLAGMRPALNHLGLDVPSRSATARVSDEGSLTATASPLHRSATEKRASTSSAHRLSFTELARRLSSTSSLLLVQSNASVASSRGSNDTIGELQPGVRGSGSPRGPVSPLPTEKEGDRPCGWRGSVGVFGGEGGFL